MREGNDAVGVAGIGRDESLAGRLARADEHRHRDRKPALERIQPREQRLARLSLSQLEDGLVGEAALAHGAARSSSSGRPLACSSRKLSFEVFSSTLRTRYAIPATMSPTGQYVRTR